MRGVQSILLACIVGLAVLAGAQSDPDSEEDWDEFDGETQTFATSESTSTSAFAVSSRASRSISVSISTTTQTVTPSLTSSAIAISAGTQSTSASSKTSSPALTGIPSSPTSEKSTEGLGSESPSSHYRSLVIILSSVLGSIGLLLAVLALFLVNQHRKRRASRRGVSPIDDEEIESWRNRERKQSSCSADGGIKHYEAGEGAIGLAWSTPPPPPVLQSPPAARINRSASFVARAPNARAGLTDEVVPGEAAFIPNVKRQSSRLSKPPPGHMRTKSRGSNTSMKSSRSINTRSFINDDSGTIGDRAPTWCASEYKSGSHAFLPTLATSSPGTSIYDGLNEQGGLSPRPKPRSMYNGIGRTIS